MKTIHLHLIPGLTIAERAALAETLSAAPAHVLLKVPEDVFPDVPRRNGLIPWQDRAVMGQMTADNRIIVNLPGLGMSITKDPVEQGKTGWIFQPKAEVKAAAAPASPDAPAPASPDAPALASPAPALASISREEVIAYLRQTATTAPKGMAALKAAASILASIP